MNRLFAMGAALAVAAWCAAGSLTAAEETKFDPQEVAVKQLKEFTVRGGLPNFYKKLAEGKPVKIAYLGGSITQQKGWRVQSLDYFRAQYPKSDAQEIFAAIGGTGSLLGAFRLEHDVLQHKPDLLFVEFAVNDAGQSPVGIRRSMEGIVRHTWRELPETDICFVYTITEQNMNELLAGKMSKSASVMEDVADYYNIPTVHFGVSVAKLFKDGKIIMKADPKGMTAVAGDSLNITSKIPMSADGKMPFSKDGVHPYPNTGHILYMNTLKKALPEIAKAGTPGPHQPLPPPVMKDCYESAKSFPLDDPAIKLSGKITKLGPEDPSVSKTFRRFMPEIWKLEPGATVEFKFKGTKAMVFALRGPGCGFMVITVDGKKPVKSFCFDAHGNYYRMATNNITSHLEGDKVHTVKIEVSGEPFDKRKFLARRKKEKDVDENPEKYAEQNVYISTVFIHGELVK